MYFGEWKSLILRNSLQSIFGQPLPNLSQATWCHYANMFGICFIQLSVPSPYIYIYIYIYICEWTVPGQQYSFSTHEQIFIWKFQWLWDRKCLHLRETRTPNLRIDAECSYHFSYQGQAFAALCFSILVLTVKILLKLIESMKTTSMEDVSTRVLEKIKNTKEGKTEKWSDVSRHI